MVVTSYTHRSSHRSRWWHHGHTPVTLHSVDMRAVYAELMHAGCQQCTSCEPIISQSEMISEWEHYYPPEYWDQMMMMLEHTRVSAALLWSGEDVVSTVNIAYYYGDQDNYAKYIEEENTSWDFLGTKSIFIWVHIGPSLHLLSWNQSINQSIHHYKSCILVANVSTRLLAKIISELTSNPSMIKLSILATNVNMKHPPKPTYIHTQKQFMKASNILATNVIIKQHRSITLINIQKGYTNY